MFALDFVCQAKQGTFEQVGEALMEVHKIGLTPAAEANGEHFHNCKIAAQIQLANLTATAGAQFKLGKKYRLTIQEIEL